MVHLVTFSLLTWDLMEVGRKRKDVDTPEEKADSLERLEKECHKRWNAETKQIEDIRWIPNINEFYYYVDSCMRIGKVYNAQSVLEKEMIEKGNCFKTKEAAQKVADQIKEIFKNSKAE